MNITEEIEINGELIEVEFSADCHVENNGIGAYNYWGVKCFDAGTNSVELDDDIEWDKEKYTDEQNQLIANQPKEFWDRLEDAFCVQYSEREPPDYDGERDYRINNVREQQIENLKLK
jgi:hypothetical protein